MFETIAGIRIPDSRLARDDATAAIVWDAIALHTTPEIPWHKRPEVALVTGGVEADVLGDGLDEIPTADRDAVLAAFPRVDFKRGIVQAFFDGFGYKPATTFGTMNDDVIARKLSDFRRTDFCDLIAANPLPESPRARPDQSKRPPPG
jgi:hypothetical protein